MNAMYDYLVNVSMVSSTTAMEVKIEELAGMYATVIESDIILPKVFNDNEMLVKQLLSYRNYLRVLFEPQ